MKQRIVIELEIPDGKDAYSNLTESPESKYDHLKSFFEDIGFKVSSIDYGAINTILVPFKEYAKEDVPMFLLMEMATIGNGGIFTGAGFGSDVLQFRWKERTAIVRCIEAFKSWVSTFDPQSAKRMQ